MSFIVNDSREQGKPYEDNVPRETKKLTFHHQKVVDELLSVIATCPMDVELKSIIRMRIWGKDPLIFAPMSHQEIAMDLKCKTKDVTRWEEDAMHNIDMFLKRTSVLDSMAKFNRDNIIKDLINPS